MRRRRHRAIEVDLTPIDVATAGDFTSAVADRDQVDEALRHLDPEWRAVVVMHYFLGMPLPEVARALGIPLGTAKSRLHRSIQAMRIAVGTEEVSVTPSIPGGQLA
jgi:RNA polymerase sigma-70 factor (ECF subfamily)